MTKLALDAEESTYLTRALTLGATTNLPVVMSHGELARLIGVVYRDTGKGKDLQEVASDLWAKIEPAADYYEIPDDWFIEPIEISYEQLAMLIRMGRQQVKNFSTYLKCLSDLHKRRRKYARILEAQPLPRMVQVSPRALIEYGHFDPRPLASWLTWRKFFYDLDNRSAQETGYIFEPILAAAIGGEPKSPRSMVVKRKGTPGKGRQVDCWKVPPTGKPLAYEFKLRVTIAASGQGRFGEELQFAEDCEFSGAIPVLIVLDPTENAKLSELEATYRARGGQAYIGADAWTHLEEEAGENLDLFLEKYVRSPIAAVSQFEVGSSGENAELLDLQAARAGSEIIFRLGDAERRIARSVDPALAVDADDGDDSDA